MVFCRFDGGLESILVEGRGKGNLVREGFGSPFTGLGREGFGSPSTGLGREGFGSPSTGLGSEGFGSPSTGLGREGFGSPSTGLGSEGFGSPSTGLGSGGKDDCVSRSIGDGHGLLYTGVGISPLIGPGVLFTFGLPVVAPSTPSSSSGSEGGMEVNDPVTGGVDVCGSPTRGVDGG